MVSYAGMNNERLEELLRNALPDLDGQDGRWHAPVGDLELFVESDEEHDRLRIMVPVAQADRTDNDLLWVLLLANYSLAVGARYAVHDGLVWCVFLHRLSWITEPELSGSLASVVSLAKNTGGTFSTTDSDVVLEG
jgi:hypothetical protein